MSFICEVDIQNDEVKYEELINLLTRATINFLNIEDNIEVAVILCDNEYIRDINYKYRNSDKSTDVISFALEDNISDVDKIASELSGSRSLGDIFISRDKVIEQSQSYGHSLKREFSFLVVHGLLHLLGYDHENDETEMFDLQEEILGSVNILKCI